MALKAPLEGLVVRDDYYCGERDWSDMEDANPPRLVLTVEPIPGDANLDGTVDDADASILAANWLGSDRDWSQGDFNNDGLVNDLDAAILRRATGTKRPTPSRCPSRRSRALAGRPRGRGGVARRGPPGCAGRNGAGW